ncbi:O-antigen ligase family protein [Sphingopyxis terrae]|nr:O-antigen ligase family protein [Sphingopyxis terrae]
MMRSSGRSARRAAFDYGMWIPALFLLFVFMTGGGSRSDIASLPFLRAGSVLFACWAIWGLRAADWRRIAVPLVLLALLALWMALQLVPLPPSMWHALPGRDLVVAADRILGQVDLWRPLTLTPSETWNSLLGMTVPVAALLVAGRLDLDGATRVLQALVAIAVVSALLGVLQLVTGNGSPAYLYRITNAGSMVGLFANRNHHAVFQACAILFAAALLRDEFMRRQQRGVYQLAYGAAAILSTAITLMTGSRAGLVAGGVAFLVGYAMLVPAWQARPLAAARPSRAARQKDAGFSRWLVYAPPLLLGALLVTIYSLADRTTSLSRMADNRVAEDLRVQAWPTIQHMIETYWVAGAGFGSFPGVYRIFEPDALLQPAYFNHAHNDWAELLLTGGLPFALIVLVAIVWFGRSVLNRGLGQMLKPRRGDYRLPILSAISLLAAASLVDYPLRTPSIQAMAVILIVVLACLKPGAAQRE